MRPAACNYQKPNLARIRVVSSQREAKQDIKQQKVGIHIRPHSLPIYILTFLHVSLHGPFLLILTFRFPKYHFSLAKAFRTCYLLYDICDKVPLLLIPGKPVSQSNLLQLQAKKRDNGLLLVQYHFYPPLIINLFRKPVSAEQCAFLTWGAFGKIRGQTMSSSLNNVCFSSFSLRLPISSLSPQHHESRSQKEPRKVIQS